MKHIKKSMFISTVLMVVMLIAALSTATFAWYTSNNTVASTSTTAGAAKSDSANIGIGWYQGARDATITFHNLVDNQGNGNMFPVAPTTYFNKVGDTAASNPADAYITSTEKTYAAADGIIEDAFIIEPEKPNPDYDSEDPESPETIPAVKADYLRVVNLATEQVTAQVKGKAAYQHNPGATGGKATNWDADDVADLAANYSVVYTTKKYAYNNTIAVANKPDLTETVYISINNHVYTVETASLTEKEVYQVSRVFEVAADGSDDIDDAVTSNNNKISPTYAHDLVNAVGHNPSNGYCVVEYIVYQDVDFAEYAKDTTKYPTAEGYIGNTAGQLNAGDISKSDLPGNPYNVNHTPKYDKDGFCYLYQIYEHDTAVSVFESAKDNYNTAGFTFEQANIATDYFKSEGQSATISQYWTGNAPDLSYNAANKQLAIVTGTTTAATKATMTSFFVTNNGSNATSVLNISLAAVGNNADNLRIAVFARQDPTAAQPTPKFQYYGTLANSDSATTFGTILKGANKDDMPKYTAQSSIDLVALQPGADYALEIQLIAWFDGTGLDDTGAGENCSFTVTISQ